MPPRVIIYKMATSQQERLVAQSLVLSIWMDKLKYEDAERKYQEIIADKHSGLKIQVIITKF